MTSIALIIFILTYAGIIFTRLPGLNIDRPSAAFMGAVLMVITGVISFQEAVSAIDFNTIALLFGMMVIITVLELDGFFTFIAHNAISLSSNPTQLLFLIIIVTGIASAFLVNDAIVLLFTPVIIKICRQKKLKPMPYLIAEIASSNAGSTLTITGNPQNILIGINSGLPYGEFLLYMLPVSFLSMAVIFVVIKILYKKDIVKVFPGNETKDRFEYHYSSMKFSVPILILVIISFFFGKMTGIAYPVTALAGAALVLLFGKIKPSRIIKEVDWVLLLFFASLFIVVHAFEKTGYIASILNYYKITPDFSGILKLHVISLLFSQIVSNVPYTVLMIPVLTGLNNKVLWLSLASASTLAGNFTIIGAMANLIVIGIAQKEKIEIKFMPFMIAGGIITLITFAISIVFLALY